MLLDGEGQDLSLGLSDSRAPALTHHASLPVIRPLASAVV